MRNPIGLPIVGQHLFSRIFESYPSWLLMRSSSPRRLRVQQSFGTVPGSSALCQGSAITSCYLRMLYGGQPTARLAIIDLTVLPIHLIRPPDPLPNLHPNPSPFHIPSHLAPSSSGVRLSSVPLVRAGPQLEMGSFGIE